MMGSRGSVAAVLLVVGLVGCQRTADPWQGLGGPPRVVTSFAPITCWVKNVAGDHAAVLSVLSVHGPHDHQYDPLEVLPLRKADVFFANGLTLDDFARKLANNCGNPQLKYVELGEALEKSQLREIGFVNHGDHTHSGHDPHVWLGIPFAKLMVRHIADVLAERDPAHAQDYQNNAAAYLKKLDKLHADGRESLKGGLKLISFHESLNYFADSFGITVAGVIEPRAGVEPDAATLSKLVAMAKEKNVRVVAVEPQFPKMTAARTLLDEMRRKGIVDPVQVEVDPLETGPTAAQMELDWYERKMRANIANLAKAVP